MFHLKEVVNSYMQKVLMLYFEKVIGKYFKRIRHFRNQAME